MLDRRVRLGRTPQRPGIDAPRRAAAQERHELRRSGGQAHAVLRPVALASLLCHGHGPRGFLQRPRPPSRPMLGLGYDVRRDGPGLCPGPQVRRRVAGSRPELLRRFLPLDALDLRAGHVDGLAVRSSRGGRRAWSRLSAGRRAHYTAAQFKLRGLDPDATYVLKNHDAAGTIEIGGRELLDQGSLRGHQGPPRRRGDYVSEEKFFACTIDKALNREETIFHCATVLGALPSGPDYST